MEMPNKCPAYAPFFVMSPRRLSIFGPKTQLPKLSRVIPVSEKQGPSGLRHGLGYGVAHGHGHIERRYGMRPHLLPSWCSYKKKKNQGGHYLIIANVGGIGIGLGIGTLSVGMGVVSTGMSLVFSSHPF